MHDLVHQRDFRYLFGLLARLPFLLAVSVSALVASGFPLWVRHHFTHIAAVRLVTPVWFVKVQCRTAG
jgi:hypothetical protein